MTVISGLSWQFFWYITVLCSLRDKDTNLCQSQNRRVTVTSFLDTPYVVQTVRVRFGNGRRDKSVYKLTYQFVFCSIIIYNVLFFPHIPFGHLKRFRMHLYFSHVMLINLQTVILFRKTFASGLQKIYIWFDDNCLQMERWCIVCDILHNVNTHFAKHLCTV